MSDYASKKRKAVEAMMAARVLKKQNNIQIIKRTKLEVWESDKFSLRKSIDAKCYDCSNYQTDEVRYCTVTKCPLWFVRPFQAKEKA